MGSKAAAGLKGGRASLDRLGLIGFEKAQQG